MRYVVHDKKYSFKFAFDTEPGAYVRTGVLDENGKDTGVDPFMGSYPHLIDVGIMGHCIHGKTGLCSKAGIGCYHISRSLSFVQSVQHYEHLVVAWAGMLFDGFQGSGNDGGRSFHAYG